MNDYILDIDFHKGFSAEEREKISAYIEEQYENGGLKLYYGLNLFIDVSDVIGRTANVDVWFSI
ncbi:hypothetical protein [Sigmofec virus UA08Rod_6752]|uniref:Uncharacterized protein n=1 Tax=Sigmofec virus UA08Rod_6752 TaxID=2929239 RepID=A0A976N0A8_9VIRU|nr:hypothetical protein [Sigmofec virus UA08Rod_6752]